MQSCLDVDVGGATFASHYMGRRRVDQRGLLVAAPGVASCGNHQAIPQQTKGE
jgi:hypothetical protein